jgi:hypothetical protein
MAVRNIQVTDSLETFRTEFNALCAVDFGDIGTLDASLSATSIIGAVNEINGVVTAAAGWFIEDSSSTIQAVGSGQTLTTLGTANQTTVLVSTPDTLTVGLADDVTIANDLTVTGNITNVGGDITVAGNVSATNITSTGPTQQLGTIVFEGNTISCTDSTEIKFDDSIEVTGIIRAGSIEMNPATGYAAGAGFRSMRPDQLILFDGLPVIKGRNIAFEGNNENDFEAVLRIAEPTQDVIIEFPDNSGDVILDVSLAYATSTIFTTTSTLNIYNSAGVLQKTIVGSAT